MVDDAKAEAAKADDDDPRDRRINRAIYNYHQAVERGESAEPQRWLERHPEIADELKAYFEDLAGVAGMPGVEVTQVGLSQAGDERDGLQPGDVLGDYVILEKLGQGGQGVVWKASPRQTPEIVVALKTMVGPAQNDPAAIDRFRNDARAIARMNHPHIVRTSYAGEADGRWFIVMELMEGGAVADRLDDFRQDPRAAAVLVEKVARAIHHAHTRNEGVIHLDLKPGNILLSSAGEPKVTDFGLAVRAEAITQALRGAESSTRSDGDVEATATLARAGVVGTAPYLSTEMAAGRWDEVSTLSDVYGLGAVLYSMLTGRPPFSGSSTAETLKQVIQGELQSPRSLNPRVDRELNAICVKCLSPEPARRYGSADALANDLRRWLERRPTLAAGRPSPLRELRFWVARHPLPLALAVLLGAAIWAGSVWLALGETRRENAAEAARLARQLDRELQMICVFTQRLAENDGLQIAWQTPAASTDAVDQRRALQSVLDRLDLRNWFELAGGNPLVNILLLDPQGVELADTMPARSTAGRSFQMRDYFQGVFAPDASRDDVHIARTFRSLKDGRHKISASTRVWTDDGRLLGVLVANFTIGPKLLGFDLRKEAGDAAVLCPCDLSDPETNQPEDPAIEWRYVVVLDRRYREDAPITPAAVDVGELRAFQRDPELRHIATGPQRGRVADYHRVGQTPLIVVARRNAPWPLSWRP